MTHKLLSTTAFRLSLIYAVVFSLIAAIALVLAYWFSAKQIRQQTDDRLQLESNVLLSRYYTGSFADLNRKIQRRTNTAGQQFFIYSLVKRQQHDFFQHVSPKLSGEHAVFATVPIDSITHIRTPARHKPNARVLITPLANDYQLLVGTDLSEQAYLLNQIAIILFIAILVIFAASLIGGSWISRHIIKRLDVIRRTAKEIIDGDLHQRIPIQHTQQDEYDKLSLVLNKMLAQLEASMQSMREVTDNLAHDLRNPLNRLRHRLETIQYLQPNSKQYQQELAIAIEDVDAIVATFNALLNIAQIEAKAQRDHWEDVDISKLINDLGELYTLVAEEKQITLKYQAEANLVQYGDKQLLAQAVSNLLDNAVKYTPEKGNVELNAYQQKDNIMITIADSGIGIPQDQYEKVFCRFTRLDNVRNTAGNGLGLSLVKAVADLHEAIITLADNKPGLKISLQLPTIKKD